MPYLQFVQKFVLDPYIIRYFFLIKQSNSNANIIRNIHLSFIPYFSPPLYFPLMYSNTMHVHIRFTGINTLQKPHSFHCLAHLHFWTVTFRPHCTVHLLRQSCRLSWYICTRDATEIMITHRHIRNFNRFHIRHSRHSFFRRLAFSSILISLILITLNIIRFTHFSSTLSHHTRKKKISDFISFPSFSIAFQLGKYRGEDLFASRQSSVRNWEFEVLNALSNAFKFLSFSVITTFIS